MTHWLTDTSAGFVFALLAGFILLLVLYLLPVLLAYSLDSSHIKGILILNATIGWTVIGWLVARVWAILSGNGGSFDDLCGDDLSKFKQNTK